MGECYQDLPRYNYEIPEPWAQKYKIKKVMIGKGACHLFPIVLECEPGLQLSKSNISGRLIVSGRAQGKENSCTN